MKQFSNILNTLSLLAVCFLLTGCFTDESELVPTNANTGLRLKLGSLSTKVVTRSAPSELPKPLASQFRVSITDSRSKVVYNDFYTEDVIPVSPGTYTITASCGQNPSISIDAPYYIGTTTATVASTDTEAKDVDITCGVGNALVSVRFGKDDAETARFDQFYSDYRVDVKVGSNSMPIEKARPDESVYFKAGSSVSLVFVGKVKALNNKEVKFELTHEDLPTTFAAADHAIVTLSPASQEYALNIAVSEVELTKADLEETIPLSWLPIPQATATHQYDGEGNLVGTNLSFTDCYPDMEWKAVVTDKNSNEVRTVQGTGSLTSAYQSQNWKYLPVGNYTATYYVIDGDKSQKLSSRDFAVTAPNISVKTVDGYTSYSKYLAGDVDAANACNANTVYGLTATLSVDPSLMADTRYTKSAKVSAGSANSTGTLSGTTFNFGNLTGIQPQHDAYALNFELVFGGATATNSTKQVYITGLPVTYNPPTANAGWTFTSGGACSFENGYMKLGTTVAPTPKAKSPKFYCPKEIPVKITSEAQQSTGVFNYTYTITFNGSGSKVENKTSKNRQTFTFEGKLTSNADGDDFITEYSYIATGNTLQIFNVKVEYK